MTPSPTTDEDALLAAITAEPLDDAPRLVYADWLQERGDDARAEYLRSVVALSHPPDNPAGVDRLAALAEGIDAGWRQQVGGRFEVVLTGNAALIAIASALQFVAHLATRLAGRWQVESPLRLKTQLTREDAEAFLAQHRDSLLGGLHALDPEAAMTVRPMSADTPTNDL